MIAGYDYFIYIHFYIYIHIKNEEKTVKVFEIKFGRIKPETGLALPFHNCIVVFMASE